MSFVDSNATKRPPDATSGLVARYSIASSGVSAVHTPAVLGNPAGNGLQRNSTTPVPAPLRFSTRSPIPVASPPGPLGPVRDPHQFRVASSWPPLASLPSPVPLPVMLLFNTRVVVAS